MKSAACIALLAAVGANATINSEMNFTATGQCYHHEKCRLKPLANFRMAKMMAEKQELSEKCARERTCPYPMASSSKIECKDGKVTMNGQDYSCNGIDLMSFVSAADLGSAVRGNDIWGWTDPVEGREIAIMCLTDGTSFIDITDATNPTVLGYLRGNRYPAATSWRDAKVFRDHVYIGSEVQDHGLQVLDLTTLRAHYDRTGSVVPLLTETYLYTEFGSSHNIVINEETGFLYAVGSKTFRGGPHILDLSTPSKPVFSTGWDTDGYTHDAQCVVYTGPDTRYTGREICFNYNEDTLTILDVTDKNDLQMIARVPYTNNYYCHQGWLNKEMTHLLMNDELDEQSTSHKNTRTLLWDVRNLRSPIHIGNHVSDELSIDHNLYITDENIGYLSNYCSGLRVVNATDIASGATPELAFFDVAPYCNTRSTSGVVFQGTWSNYPYFKSGNIAVSSIELGLFVLRLQDDVKKN
eukprot:TRINITY_DN8808_c0_g1_i2.p1 TRINITY_DN8808_c0_g1~~TRINITY_DN8808_c0_g1_i2.p1  ORF type:complete len:468 (+),score=118.36 TRINITY_DN8808_c0_g1_i2:51-1454(+)